MKTLIINGSPHQSGTVATLLKAVTVNLKKTGITEWINVYDLSIKPCMGCMKCRQENTCCLPVDDAHTIGTKIKDADLLIIGTPTYWGNMSGQLKLLLERNVPVFMGEGKTGMPEPRQKDKKAVIVTACTTPFPFNQILSESRGAIRSVKHILKYGGYQIIGILSFPGTKKSKTIHPAVFRRAEKIGKRLNSK